MRHSCPVRLQAKEALKDIESIDGKFICPNCNKNFDLMIKLKNHYMEIHVNNLSPKKKTVKEEIKEEQQPMFRYVFNNFLLITSKNSSIHFFSLKIFLRPPILVHIWNYIINFNALLIRKRIINF